MDGKGNPGAGTQVVHGDPCVVTASDAALGPALHDLPREDYESALRVEAKRMEERAGVLGQQVVQAG